MLDALAKPKTRRREHSSRSLDEIAARERSKTEKSLEVARVKQLAKELGNKACFSLPNLNIRDALHASSVMEGDGWRGDRRWLANAIVRWPCRPRRHPLLLSSFGYRVHLWCDISHTQILAILSSSRILAIFPSHFHNRSIPPNSHHPSLDVIQPNRTLPHTTIIHLCQASESSTPRSCISSFPAQSHQRLIDPSASRHTHRSSLTPIASYSAGTR